MTANALPAPTADALLAARFQFAGQNIPALLQQWSEEIPDKIFLQWEPFTGSGQHWTYAKFWRDVQSFAAGLQWRGIGVGERVIIHCDNCPEMLIAWYACATIGAIAVTTNTGAAPAEMRHYIAKSEPAAAITQPRYAALLAEFGDTLRWIAVTPDDSGEPASAARNHLLAFESLFLHGASPALLAPEPLRPAGIMYTSGTTGLPKAVIHTHANVLWAGRVGPGIIDFRGDDCMLVHFPLFHANAQLWAVATALGVGGRCVIVPKVSVSRFWTTVARHGVTHCSAMPLLVQGLADAPVPPHRLRVVSAMISPELDRHWRVRALGMWGMSETVIPSVATNVLHRWAPWSMGRPTPGYQARIADPDTGAECGVDEPGELQIRGTPGVQVFFGYYNDADATAKAFTADGWLHTGDRARLGTDGTFYFVDRVKDVLKVGGENVGAAEIEAVIAAFAEVKEVAVVARKDKSLDEVPVAFVILRDGVGASAELAAQIIRRCADDLARFKVPRAVYFEAEFPRALLGKIAKNRLRELANARAD
jgi:crotonobetaine/carnitine-CoA ligase